MEEWAVVQDLRPFGLRIESTHDTVEEARRAVGSSKYLHVMWLHDAICLNEYWKNASIEVACEWIDNNL